MVRCYVNKTENGKLMAFPVGALDVPDHVVPVYIPMF